MFQAKQIDVSRVRDLYKLSPDGLLANHDGTIAHTRKRGIQLTVPLANGELISLRRAIWACAYDSLPEKIHKKRISDIERLDNLTDKPLNRRSQYQARVMVNGRSTSLGYHATQRERDEAIEEYEKYGETLTIKADKHLFKVIRHVGIRTTSLGLYPTRDDAEQVVRGRYKYGLRVPGFAYSSVTGERRAVGMFRDAFEAKQAVNRWIITEGFLLGFDQFEKI